MNDSVDNVVAVEVVVVLVREKVVFVPVAMVEYMGALCLCPK